MDKSILLQEITVKLDLLRITYSLGQSSDVEFECEFLNAGWGAGNKKINYTSSVYFNESENTVYMWELTKEIGSGFSFGSDSEVSFQSGTTLFRKVKSVQYGLDGKAYEYTLDLGAIPKIFKETAKAHGWKFKTVLKRDKASYPPGYVHSTDVCRQYGGNETIPQVNIIPKQDYSSYPSLESHTTGASGKADNISGPEAGNLSDVQPAQKTKNKGGIKGLLYWIGILLLVLITVLLFSYSKNSIIGWGLAAAVLVLMLVLRKAAKKKGCLIDIIIWIAAVVVLFMIYAFTLGES